MRYAASVSFSDLPRFPLTSLAAWLVVGCLTACGNGGSDASEEPSNDPSGQGELCTSNDDCDDGDFCNGEERCRLVQGGEMRCIVSGTPCVESQLCDEDDDVCRTQCDVTEDADGDGSVSMDCGGDDCDDANRSRFPGAQEVCDPYDTDEDCDPETVGFLDVDGDEFISSACCNEGPDDALICGDDCDDEKRSVNPGAQELCDGVDNDCNGDVDDLLAEDEVYLDRDGDGFGDSDAPQSECSSDPDTLYSTVGGDCDDAARSVNPAQTEACDGVDNDCDGEVDEGVTISLWVDADGDDHGDPDEPTEGCVSRRGVAVDLGDDCDDTNRNVHPDAFDDNCDGLDNDCDGDIDEEPDVVPLWYLDEDGDGFGEISSVLSECIQDKPGYSRFAGDCNDADATVYPGAVELCDRIDNDCSGNYPTGGSGGEDTREDADADGFSAVDHSCVVDGAPLSKTDCDDDDGDTYPGAAAVCDGLNNDCDGPGAQACSYFAHFAGPTSTTGYTYQAATDLTHANCNSRPGRFLTGYQDRFEPDGFVASLNAQCSLITTESPPDNEQVVTSDPLLVFTTGWTGTVTNQYCPAGQLMTGIGMIYGGDGLAGSYPQCTAFDLNTGTTPTVLSSTWSGVGGVQRACPAGQAVTGLVTYDSSPAYDPITRVEVNCQEVQGYEY